MLRRVLPTLLVFSLAAGCERHPVSTLSLAPLGAAATVGSPTPAAGPQPQVGAIASPTAPIAGTVRAPSLDDLDKVTAQLLADGIMTNNGGSLVANNAAGVMGNNAGNLISNNAGSLIGNNAAGLIGNNAAGLVGVEGAGIEVSALAGGKLTSAPLVTGSGGSFSLAGSLLAAYKVLAVGPDVPLVVTASLAHGGHTYTWSAIASFASAQGHPLVIDPASTLITKAVRASVASGRLAADAVKPEALQAMADALAPFLTERGQVESLAIDPPSAGATLTVLASASPALTQALNKAAADAKAPTLEVAYQPPGSSTPTPSTAPGSSSSSSSSGGSGGGGSGGGGSGGGFVPPPAVSPTAPIVTGYDQTTGSAGDLLTITGSQFGAPGTNVVTFGGGAVGSVLTESATQLQVAVPPTAATGPVTVTTNGQTGTGPTYNVVIRPVVTNVAPLKGSSNTLVTITGDNFGPTPSDNQVTVGGLPALVVSASPTQLQVKPAPTNGVGVVAVTVNGQTGASSQSFTSVASGGQLANYTISVSANALAFDLEGDPWLAYGGGPNQGLEEVAADNGQATRYVITSQPAALAFDSQGNAWYTTYEGTLEKVTSAGVQSGSFPVASSPRSIAIDLLDNIWVSSPAGKVYKFSPAGIMLNSYSGVSSPGAIATDAQGNAWVLDTSANKVLKLSPSGAVLATHAVGTFPQAVAVDSQGNAWVANNGSNNVMKVATDGTLLGTFAVSQACALVIDAQDNAWVLSQGTGAVTKLSSNGTVLATYQTGGYSYCMALDHVGNIWVSGNTTLKELVP